MGSLENLPVLCICGYKGSGKTTVIEKLIPRLTDKGLRVAAIKHDVHGLNVDASGKDSDRLYHAGADVLVRGPEQGFFRMKDALKVELKDVLRTLAPYYDLILIEGHKSIPLPNKIWLRRNPLDACPSEITGVRLELDRDTDRAGVAARLLDDLLPEIWSRTRIYGGVLMGGKSSRMGRPKHLIHSNGRSWLGLSVGAIAPLVDEVVLLGSGEVPDDLKSLRVLPDVPDAVGPLAGMLSAMRWQPRVSWLFAPCDLPFVSVEAAEWLLATRAPGIWATLPRLPGAAGVEPLFAHYDYRSLHLLERLERPAGIVPSPKIATPSPPEAIASAWENMNTPGDMNRLAVAEQSRHS